MAALRHTLAENPLRLRSHPLEVYTEAFEHTRRNAFTLSDEAKQQVLRANVVMIQTSSLVNGELDNLLCPWCQADLPHGGAVAPTNDELDGRPDLVQFDTQV